MANLFWPTLRKIEAQAKRRIANEYDAAQDRKEVGQRTGRPKVVPDGNYIPSAEDVGFSRKDIHDARKVRDAEDKNPGVIRESKQRYLTRPCRDWSLVRQGTHQLPFRPKPVISGRYESVWETFRCPLAVVGDGG